MTIGRNPVMVSIELMSRSSYFGVRLTAIACLALMAFLSANQRCTSQEFKRYPTILETNLVFWFSFDSAPIDNPAGWQIWTNDLGGDYSLVTTNLKRSYKRLTYTSLVSQGHGTLTPPPALQQNDSFTVALCSSFQGGGWATNYTIARLSLFGAEIANPSPSTNTAFILTLRVVRNASPGGVPTGPYFLQLAKVNSSVEVVLATHQITPETEPPSTTYDIAFTRQFRGVGTLYVNETNYPIQTGEVLDLAEPIGQSFSVGTTNGPFLGQMDNLVVIRRAITTDEWTLLRKPYPWRFGIRYVRMTPYGPAALLDVFTGEPWRPFNLVQSQAVDGIYRTLPESWNGYFTKTPDEGGLTFWETAHSKGFFRAVLSNP